MCKCSKYVGFYLDKKVGADGLSKKERRALKVAQKSESTANHVKETKSVSNVSVTNKSAQETTAKVKNDQRQQIQTPAVKKNNDDNKGKTVVKQQQDSNKTEIPTTTPTISKAQLRAERRALQEKQRLAKVQEQPKTIEKPVKESPRTAVVSTPKKSELKADSGSKHRVHLFNHLYFDGSTIGDNEKLVSDLHSSFIRLGVQYSSKTVLGSNARCLALLSALKEFIVDFSAPINQEFCRAVEFYLQKNTNYLQKCRPFAVSMTNALKHFKLCLTQIDTNLTDIEKKDRLLDILDTYKQEQIAKAGEAISLKVNEKITDNDFILTYGW